MSDVFKTIVSLGITAGLSDREGFVNGVSGFIKDYQQDPEKAKKWAAAIVSYLDTVKTNINEEKVFKNALSDAHLPDHKQIESLTAAIEGLTKELQKKRDK